MRTTSKHLRSEMRGPGVVLHIVERDVDDIDSSSQQIYEIGWYSYDVAGRIREALQSALTEYSRPLQPHDIERLRAYIQRVKDKHAKIARLHLGDTNEINEA